MLMIFGCMHRQMKHESWEVLLSQSKLLSFSGFLFFYNIILYVGERRNSNVGFWYHCNRNIGKTADQQSEQLRKTFNNEQQSNWRIQRSAAGVLLWVWRWIIIRIKNMRFKSQEAPCRRISIELPGRSNWRLPPRINNYLTKNTIGCRRRPIVDSACHYTFTARFVPWKTDESRS